MKRMMWIDAVFFGVLAAGVVAGGMVIRDLHHRLCQHDADMRELREATTLSLEQNLKRKAENEEQAKINRIVHQLFDFILPKILAAGKCVWPLPNGFDRPADWHIPPQRLPVTPLEPADVP